MCVLIKIKSDLNLPEARAHLHIRLPTLSKIDGAKLLVLFWEISVKNFKVEAEIASASKLMRHMLPSSDETNPISFRLKSRAYLTTTGKMLPVYLRRKLKAVLGRGRFYWV